LTGHSMDVVQLPWSWVKAHASPTNCQVLHSIQNSLGHISWSNRYKGSSLLLIALSWVIFWEMLVTILALFLEV
jgi:hypothetical protein